MKSIKNFIVKKYQKYTIRDKYFFAEQNIATNWKYISRAGHSL